MLFDPGSLQRLYHSTHALLLIEATTLQQWFGIGHPLQRHQFSGLVGSAGELLHTP